MKQNTSAISPFSGRFQTAFSGRVPFRIPFLTAPTEHASFQTSLRTWLSVVNLKRAGMRARRRFPDHYFQNFRFYLLHQRCHRFRLQENGTRGLLPHVNLSIALLEGAGYLRCRMYGDGGGTPDLALNRNRRDRLSRLRVACRGPGRVVLRFDLVDPGEMHRQESEIRRETTCS